MSQPLEDAVYLVWVGFGARPKKSFGLFQSLGCTESKNKTSCERKLARS